MSRGGFDIDDFRDSDWEPKNEGDLHAGESFGFGIETNAGRSGSPGGAQSKRKLAELREAESDSDRVANRDHEQQQANHPPRPRDPLELATIREL